MQNVPFVEDTYLLLEQILENITPSQLNSKYNDDDDDVGNGNIVAAAAATDSSESANAKKIIGGRRNTDAEVQLGIDGAYSSANQNFIQHVSTRPSSVVEVNQTHVRSDVNVTSSTFSEKNNNLNNTTSLCRNFWVNSETQHDIEQNRKPHLQTYKENVASQLHPIQQQHRDHQTEYQADYHRALSSVESLRYQGRPYDNVPTAQQYLHHQEKKQQQRQQQPQFLHHQDKQQQRQQDQHLEFSNELRKHQSAENTSVNNSFSLARSDKSTEQTLYSEYSKNTIATSSSLSQQHQRYSPIGENCNNFPRQSMNDIVSLKRPYDIANDIDTAINGSDGSDNDDVPIKRMKKTKKGKKSQKVSKFLNHLHKENMQNPISAQKINENFNSNTIQILQEQRNNSSGESNREYPLNPILENVTPVNSPEYIYTSTLENYPNTSGDCVNGTNNFNIIRAEQLNEKITEEADPLILTYLESTPQPSQDAAKMLLSLQQQRQQQQQQQQQQHQQEEQQDDVLCFEITNEIATPIIENDVNSVNFNSATSSKNRDVLHAALNDAQIHFNNESTNDGDNDECDAEEEAADADNEENDERCTTSDGASLEILTRETADNNNFNCSPQTALSSAPPPPPAAASLSIDVSATSAINNFIFDPTINEVIAYDPPLTASNYSNLLPIPQQVSTTTNNEEPRPAPPTLSCANNLRKRKILNSPISTVRLNREQPAAAVDKTIFDGCRENIDKIFKKFKKKNVTFDLHVIKKDKAIPHSTYYLSEPPIQLDDTHIDYRAIHEVIGLVRIEDLIKKSVQNTPRFAKYANSDVFYKFAPTDIGANLRKLSAHYAEEMIISGETVNNTNSGELNHYPLLLGVVPEHYQTAALYFIQKMINDYLDYINNKENFDRYSKYKKKKQEIYPFGEGLLECMLYYYWSYTTQDLFHWNDLAPHTFQKEHLKCALSLLNHNHHIVRTISHVANLRSPNGLTAECILLTKIQLNNILYESQNAPKKFHIKNCNEREVHAVWELFFEKCNIFHYRFSATHSKIKAALPLAADALKQKLNDFHSEVDDSNHIIPRIFTMKDLFLILQMINCHYLKFFRRPIKMENFVIRTIQQVTRSLNRYISAYYLYISRLFGRHLIDYAVLVNSNVVDIEHVKSFRRHTYKKLAPNESAFVSLRKHKYKYCRKNIRDAVIAEIRNLDNSKCKICFNTEAVHEFFHYITTSLLFALRYAFISNESVSTLLEVRSVNTPAELLIDALKDHMRNYLFDPNNADTWDDNHVDSDMEKYDDNTGRPIPASIEIRRPSKNNKNSNAEAEEVDSEEEEEAGTNTTGGGDGGVVATNMTKFNRAMSRHYSNSNNVVAAVAATTVNIVADNSKTSRSISRHYSHSNNVAAAVAATNTNIVADNSKTSRAITRHHSNATNVATTATTTTAAADEEEDGDDYDDDYEDDDRSSSSSSSDGESDSENSDNESHREKKLPIKQIPNVSQSSSSAEDLRTNIPNNRTNIPNNNNDVAYDEDLQTDIPDNNDDDADDDDEDENFDEDYDIECEKEINAENDCDNNDSDDDDDNELNCNNYEAFESGLSSKNKKSNINISHLKNIDENDEPRSNARDRLLHTLVQETPLKIKRKTVNESKIFIFGKTKLERRIKCVLCNTKTTLALMTLTRPNAEIARSHSAEITRSHSAEIAIPSCVNCGYLCCELQIDPQDIIRRIDALMRAPILFDNAYHITPFKSCKYKKAKSYDRLNNIDSSSKKKSKPKKITVKDDCDDVDDGK